MDPPSARPAHCFEPTRSAGLARLAGFVPRAGRQYAAGRNIDTGAGPRDNVSMLSPYLRYRLLTECEVLHAVLERHGRQDADKFVQEVLWRSYWKGWLEMRPNVWRQFIEDRRGDAAGAAADTGRGRSLIEAETGTTGIEGFDDWARELVETGYLHNHARMWFASIWIFTLKLPWTLGADFFLRHLVDADPASNTLGWRWVAGIQTPGKTYLATADNIEKYTGGRFRPSGLATRAEPVDGRPVPPAASLSPIGPCRPDPLSKALLLLHAEDFQGHELVPDGPEIAAVLVCGRGATGSEWPWGENAAAFVETAAEDSARRAAEALDVEAGLMTDIDAAGLAERARRAGVTTIVTPCAPVGPVADGLDRLGVELQASGIALQRLRRDWDARAWPRATRGFFPFRKEIPALLDRAGLP